MKTSAILMMYDWNAGLWRELFNHLATFSDEIHIRFDESKTSPEFVAEVMGYDNVHLAQLKPHAFNQPQIWREELLRTLDGSCPDLVITLDQDEMFGKGISRELRAFYESSKQAMMFDYEMVSSDGRPLPVYPPKPHMKVFRWKPGLSYAPYMGYARVTQYAKNQYHWRARTKIRHYCMYTPEMEAAKRKHLKSMEPVYGKLI